MRRSGIEGEQGTAAEDKIHSLIDQHKPDFMVLARYMQILSNEFVNRYPQRIINIHHSFLPAFVGASLTIRHLSVV